MTRCIPSLPMRRAATQVLRSARRPLIRPLHRSRSSAAASHSHATNGLNHRHTTTKKDRSFVRDAQSLPSSMYSRSFSVALVSSLVASGAYFAYQGTAGQGEGKLSNSPVSGLAQQNRAYASDSSPSGGLATSTEVRRKALVVDNYQLYTGEITGTAPLAKTTDDYGRKILEMMTPDQATDRIRRNEESYLVGRGKGVVRYDVVQLPSNDPIEDDHVEKIIEAPHNPSTTTGNNDWMFWGVFDGHSGWTTSATLRQSLISYVARELNTTYTSATTAQSSNLNLPTPSSIDAAIKRGFLALDKSIVQDSVAQVLRNKSKAQAASLLAPALSGSCALLSFYDSSSKTLRVACTGDSRAVLGRRSTSNDAKWIAMPLSVDQTGGTPSEASRLRAEHPNEPDVVRNGRVLGGLEPSRAFGDATYKWSKEIQDKIKKEYLGRSANPNIRTPPYVTAEPVVTTTQVQPEKGDFVVMATDGLWEMLTNEEVVGLVGSWLEKHPEAQGAVSAGRVGENNAKADSWLASWFSGQRTGSGKELPVAGESHGASGGQRAPIRQQQWGLSPSTGGKNGAPMSERFVVEDKNAATHLIRNALGGANRDSKYSSISDHTEYSTNQRIVVCGLLTLPSPYSRRYR